MVSLNQHQPNFMVSLLHCCMRTTLETEIVKPRPLRGVTQTPSQLKSSWNVLEIGTYAVVAWKTKKAQHVRDMQCIVYNQAIKKVFEVKNLEKWLYYALYAQTCLAGWLALLDDEVSIVVSAMTPHGNLLPVSGSGWSETGPGISLFRTTKSRPFLFFLERTKK